MFAYANGALAGNQALGANSAVLVRSTNAAIAGTYLVINNATPGRSDGDDAGNQPLPARGAALHLQPGLVFL